MRVSAAASDPFEADGMLPGEAGEARIIVVTSGKVSGLAGGW